MEFSFGENDFRVRPTEKVAIARRGSGQPDRVIDHPRSGGSVLARDRVHAGVVLRDCYGSIIVPIVFLH